MDDRIPPTQTEKSLLQQFELIQYVTDCGWRTVRGVSSCPICFAAVDWESKLEHIRWHNITTEET